MKKKDIKLIIILVSITVIFIFLLLIYKNIFSGTNSSRNNDIKDYKISNNEINAVKNKINELEEVKTVDIHTNNNSKIVKIVVVLSSDIDFKEIQTVANESLTNFKKENLSYYDIEFYIDTENEESETYPQIGYKFKTNSEFSW